MNVAARLPIKKDMKDATPEPRTPVMIMVDATWQDHNGTVQTARSRIENKSAGGACIRLSKRISVGTRLKIEGQWEKFSGEARYCRKDGRDYLVGIQKDRTQWPAATRVVGEPATSTKVAAGMEDVGLLVNTWISKAGAAVAESQIARRPEQESSEAVPEASNPPQMASDLPRERENTSEASIVEGAVDARQERLERGETKKAIQRLDGPAGGQERKHMKRKWFEMAHKDENEEQLNTVVNDAENPETRAPATFALAEPVLGERPEDKGAAGQLELLAMEDIYRMAGILNPRKGYSINKIAEMLNSEHLRGLSKEMKRASVLMALDAAGVTIEEVLQDAQARRDAIDAYEADQRRQFEAQLARKAEENTQIQAELERVKARYTERLRRNLDGIAREKATFGNWLTLKQQEAQSMAEAVDMCAKAPVAEAPSTALEEVSFAGARGKPV